MLKYSFAIIFFLAGCVTERYQPKETYLNVNMPYKDAYERINGRAGGCYPYSLVDADFYTTNPAAEISINHKPRGNTYYNGITMVAEPGYQQNVLNIIIEKYDEENSDIKLSDDRYVPYITNWLKGLPGCPTIK